MVDIISKIERIKYKVFQKELEKKKIDDLEKLLQSPHITYEDVILIQDVILKLKNETKKVNKVKEIFTRQIENIILDYISCFKSLESAIGYKFGIDWDGIRKHIVYLVKTVCHTVWRAYRGTTRRQNTHFVTETFYKFFNTHHVLIPF